MEDRKLVDFAHWLNDHPGEWNLWPYLIPIQADRRDTVASMRLVMERIKNHRYDEFRVDTVLLEYELFNGFMGFGRYSMTACCSRRRAARPRTGEAATTSYEI